MGLLLVCLTALIWIGNAGAAITVIDPTLLADAQSNPAESEPVIIVSDAGVTGATDAFDTASAIDDGYGSGVLRKKLAIVGGVAATLPASRITTLASLPGLTVSPDSELQESGHRYRFRPGNYFDSDGYNPRSSSGPENYSNIQLWPYLSGLSDFWTAPLRIPTIAVVDSGVDASVPDLANRLLVPQVDLCHLAPNSPGDGDGHGTFVSSILAGVADGHAGAVPRSKLISLDVINDQGEALTSDVIAAAQWIFNHRFEYDIRVANLSLEATTPSHFVDDPLDKAVEKLWFGGVVVVTAAGNYGEDSQPTSVRYAPANDPFVITVGALDNMGTLGSSDDVAAPWSTWGYTLDGFAKPEIGASGRYMIGAVPDGSELLSEFSDNVFAPGYLQLSGTSFAAPVVAGAAADVLAVHPFWTTDQVKGALMLGSEETPAATPGSLGVGEVNASKAASLTHDQLFNPNAALDSFLVYPCRVRIPYFDAASWENAVASNPDWNAYDWEAKWWTSASDETKWWTSVSWVLKWWTSKSSETKWWTTVSGETKWWTAVSASDKAWKAQNQLDLVEEALAEGDMSSSPNLLDPSDLAALLLDEYPAPAS